MNIDTVMQNDCDNICSKGTLTFLWAIPMDEPCLNAAFFLGHQKLFLDASQVFSALGSAIDSVAYCVFVATVAPGFSAVKPSHRWLIWNTFLPVRQSGNVATDIRANGEVDDITESGVLKVMNENFIRWKRCSVEGILNREVMEMLFQNGGASHLIMSCVVSVVNSLCSILQPQVLYFTSLLVFTSLT